MNFWQKLASKVNDLTHDSEDEARFEDYNEVISERTEVQAPEAETPAQQAQPALNAVSEAGGNINLKFARPSSYSDEDVGEIAEYLLQGFIVVLDVEAMDRGDIMRLLDFLNGVTYVIDGTITQRNQKTFVITPSNVSITE